jgi:serine/threonine protein kinase
VDSAIDDVSYLVTPYLGEDLTRLPDVAEPQAVLERFRGIVVAVNDAHAYGVVHRDIKPDNVIVDEAGTPFLVDFGICAMDGSEVILTTTVEGFGNRSFAPPECDAGSPDDASEASDIYSLGKLLYWMTSGRRFMVRESFDRDTLTIADPHACQYISVLIEHTVREDPGARWSSTELLQRIDWALDKLDEQSAIRETGLTVLEDGFGPNDQCNEGSYHSATRTPRGNPSADHDIAQSFFVDEVVALDQIDIGVTRLHGSGQADVVLVKGGLQVPSEDSRDVIEKWDGTLTETGTPQILRLPSTSRPTLGPSEVYWVILSPSEGDGEIAWMSAALELMPRMATFAERNRPDPWQARKSVQGPGPSLRVLARGGRS